MPTPSSQGSTCSFNGQNLGRITRWRVSGGTAVFVEKTNITSEVVGYGSNARIVKTYDCVAIDPGTVEVTLYGCPPFVNADTGLRASVSVFGDGVSLTRPAYIESFDVTGSVGEFLVGQAIFKLTGEGS
jgi:hypothetical protein